jgi:hypothetical protein
MTEKLSACRKRTDTSLTGELRWRGRVLEQKWKYEETETDEIAGVSRTVCTTFKWWPVPEYA